MKLPEILTKKVGPLPVWGYAVAGAGMLFVVSKMKGGGGGGKAGGQGISIPTLTPGSASSPWSSGGGISTGGNAVGSPGQNAQGGSDTQPGGTPPWWVTPPPPWSSRPNNSAPGGPPKNDTTPPPKVPDKTAAPSTSWFTRLTAPLNTGGGVMPAGAAVTRIGGTDYSLSSDALARAAPTGSGAPAGSVSTVRTDGSMPFFTNNAGQLQQGEGPRDRGDN